MIFSFDFLEFSFVSRGSHFTVEFTVTVELGLLLWSGCLSCFL